MTAPRRPPAAPTTVECRACGDDFEASPDPFLGGSMPDVCNDCHDLPDAAEPWTEAMERRYPIRSPR